MIDFLDLPQFLDDRNPIFLYLAIVPGIAYVLWLFIGALLLMAPKLEKSWGFAFISQLIGDILISAGLTGAIAIVTDNLFLSIIIAVVFWGHIQVHKNFIQHKPRSWRLYRMPLLDIEGSVVEKRVHTKHQKIKYLREWIIFKTVDNQQMKVYYPYDHSKDERLHFQSFSVGDKGTLVYREGKKHCYFEEFQPESDGTECESGKAEQEKKS